MDSYVPTWLGTPFGEKLGNPDSPPFDGAHTPSGGIDAHHDWPSPPLPSSEPPYPSETYVTIPDSWSQTLDSLYGSVAGVIDTTNNTTTNDDPSSLLLVLVPPAQPQTRTPSSALPISPSRASSQSGGLAYHLSTPPNLKANLSPEHLLGLLPACPSPRKACGLGGVPQLFNEAGVYQFPTSPRGVGLGGTGDQHDSVPLGGHLAPTFTPGGLGGTTPISYVVNTSPTSTSSQVPAVPFRLLFPSPAPHLHVLPVK
ncbi:hypothetical protein NMY22_g7593 [Coprinellus aureogranulatus]|nr:hypothetical protein NMY22_g7593 [Coprinellus aureogranulatus]